MMSTKLDKSLDDISKDRRGNGRRNGGPGLRRAAKARPAGPTGGISKKASTKAPAKGPAKTSKKVTTVPVVPANAQGKIIVSGLPADVTEQQVKEYFDKTIGPVKRVFLTYGPNGQSKGISTITFNSAEHAHKAAQNLNGVKVDNRTMKVEVVLGASQAPAPAPAKGLSDRIAKPKSAAAPKANTNKKAGKPGAKPTAAPANGQKGKGAGRNKARTNRPKPKTAEQLDAEMTDYFDANAAGNAAPAAGNGAAIAAPAATGGDAMEDEVL